MTNHCTVDGQSFNFITEPSNVIPTLHLMKFWMQEKLEIDRTDEDEEVALQFLSMMLV